MKNFFKPSRGKIILTIVLLVVFSFLGVSHVQICKMPPCETPPLYASLIMFITLWPLSIDFIIPRVVSIFIVSSGFLMSILDLILFLFFIFYYYTISCFWFYKKNTWKIKKYFLFSMSNVRINLP